MFESKTLLALPLAALALTFGAASCASTGDAAPGEKMEAKEASAKSDKKEDSEKKAAKKAIKIADKEREIQLAGIEMRLAETKRKHSFQQADEAVVKAEREVEKAEQALRLFESMERPKRVRGMEIQIAQSEYGIQNAEEELAQMISDYEGQEEFYAKATGEIVVERARKQLEFRRARHELTRMDQTKLMETELPDEEEELRHELELKRAALARANEKAADARLEDEADRIRADAKLEKLRRELEELRSGDDSDDESGEKS